MTDQSKNHKMEEAGKALQHMMQQHGDTRTSLAKKMGVSRPTLDKILYGNMRDQDHFEKYMMQAESVYGARPDRNSGLGKKIYSGIYLNPGNDGFAEIRRGKYIDKSGLIRLVNQNMDTSDKLICVSRPRRFGKSFAAKMLSAYYDKSCDSAELFRDLAIADDPDYSKWRNQLDVISLDITGFISDAAAAGKNVDQVVQNIQTAIRTEVSEAYPDAAGESIGELLVSVAQKYGDRFFFIIDEWDALFREAPDKLDVQEEYMNFLRSLFKNGSVTARAVAGAYITGILPIRKDGSESAISDFNEYTMLNPGVLFPYFGFTEKEVHDLCDEYQMDFATAKRWYDGYNDPEGEPLYNPYSVMKAMKNHRFGSYWRQSSATDVLSDYIDLDYDGLSGCVAALLGGISVPVDISGFNNDLISLKNKDDVLTLLIHLGYLSYDQDEGTVHIPNEEIQQEFARSVQEVKSTDTIEWVRASRKLIMDTISGNEEAVAAAIEKVHEEETAPFFYNNEQSLRSVVKLAYFAYRDYYIAMEELPSGKGYVDIAYLPKRDTTLPALVIELKWNKEADTAIEQIKNRHYPEKLLHDTRRILLVGISYNKGDPEKKHTCRIEALSL